MTRGRCLERVNRRAHQAQGGCKFLSRVAGWDSDRLGCIAGQARSRESGPCVLMRLLPPTSPVAARMAVAAGDLATRSLRGHGATPAVPPLAPELLEYFGNRQVKK